MKLTIINWLLLVLANCLPLALGQALFDSAGRVLYTPEAHNGFYDVWYPGYHDDSPKPWHYTGPAHFGLPLGGFARNGQPYGMSAYLHRPRLQHFRNHDIFGNEI